MVSVLVTIDNTPPLDVAWPRLRVGDGKGEGLVQALLGSWLAHARSTPLQPDSGWVAVVLLWCRGIVFTRRHLLCFGTCRCSNLTQQLWVTWIGKTKAPLKGSSADLVLSQRISAFHTHCGLGINPACWEILTIAGARESPSRSCVFMHGSKPARDGWAYLFGLTYLERVAYVNSNPLSPPPARNHASAPAY